MAIPSGDGPGELGGDRVAGEREGKPGRRARPDSRDAFRSSPVSLKFKVMTIGTAAFLFFRVGVVAPGGLWYRLSASEGAALSLRKAGPLFDEDLASASVSYDANAWHR